MCRIELYSPALRRWLKLAQRSAGKQRLAYLIQHIINTWVWTLEQRRGTPCMPLIITYRCSNDASCGGIGDRIKGLSMAFWMVRVGRTWRAGSPRPPRRAAPTSSLSITTPMALVRDQTH
jgi:hypothetical protein